MVFCDSPSNIRLSSRLSVRPEDIPITLIKACKGERGAIYLQGEFLLEEMDNDHLQSRTVDNDHVLSKTLSTADRRQFLFLALYPNTPLDIRLISLIYPQECQALRVQGTGSVREEACNRCKRIGEGLKFLFPTCRSLSNLGSIALAADGA